MDVSMKSHVWLPVLDKTSNSPATDVGPVCQHIQPAVPRRRVYYHDQFPIRGRTGQVIEFLRDTFLPPVMLTDIHSHDLAPLAKVRARQGSREVAIGEINPLTVLHPEWRGRHVAISQDLVAVAKVVAFPVQKLQQPHPGQLSHGFSTCSPVGIREQSIDIHCRMPSLEILEERLQKLNGKLFLLHNRTQKRTVVRKQITTQYDGTNLRMRCNLKESRIELPMPMQIGSEQDFHQVPS